MAGGAAGGSGADTVGGSSTGPTEGGSGSDVLPSREGQFPQKATLFERAQQIGERVRRFVDGVMEEFQLKRIEF